MKLQRRNAGGKKSEQHPYHPHPKPLCVKSVVGCAHQESVCTASLSFLKDSETLARAGMLAFPNTEQFSVRHIGV